MKARHGAQALRNYQTEVSQAKQRSVLQAIEDHMAGSVTITVAGISRTANVSREFIHSHPHLHKAVREAAEQMTQAKAVFEHPARADVEGLRADRKNFLYKIERQKSQILEQLSRLKALEEQRQRWLGSQLSNLEAVDPEIHAELQLTNERLMSDNAKLRRKVAEQRQLLETAQVDLAAVREGWAEDIARYTKHGAEVLPLHRSRASST